MISHKRFDNLEFPKA